MVVIARGLANADNLHLPHAQVTATWRQGDTTLLEGFGFRVNGLGFWVLGSTLLEGLGVSVNGLGLWVQHCWRV